jgi:hypothetical protein
LGAPDFYRENCVRGHFSFASSPSSTSLITLTVEPSARLSELQLAAPASPEID